MPQTACWPQEFAFFIRSGAKNRNNNCVDKNHGGNAPEKLSRSEIVSWGGNLFFIFVNIIPPTPAGKRKSTRFSSEIGVVGAWVGNHIPRVGRNKGDYGISRAERVC